MKIISMDNLNTINEEPFQVAVTVCKLTEPDEMTMAMFESFTESMKVSEKSSVSTTLDSFDELLKK